MIESIQQWQMAVADSRVAFTVSEVGDFVATLAPGEFDVIANSAEIRRNTYSTGRYCAKQSLLALGVVESDYPDGLLRLQDGSVNWPAKCVGSISHTNTQAIAAAVFQNEPYRSIGIDIEHIDRVQEDILSSIASESERHYLANHKELHWGRAGPLYGKYIRFQDIEITSLHQKINTDNLPMSLNVFSPTLVFKEDSLRTVCDEMSLEIRVAVLDDLLLSFVGLRV